MSGRRPGLAAIIAAALLCSSGTAGAILIEIVDVAESVAYPSLGAFGAVSGVVTGYLLGKVGLARGGRVREPMTK